MPRWEVHFCGHCGLTSGGRRVFADDMWQGRWYCGDVCQHAAGDRTNCDRWDCGCSAYAKLLRVLQGVLVGLHRLRYELERPARRRDPRADRTVDMDALNLPYNPAMHLRLARHPGDGGVDDRLDPDREERDAELRREIGADKDASDADRAAFVEVAAQMALHNQNKQNNPNKRQRLDDSSTGDLADVRLQNERMATKREDMHMQMERERENMRLQMEREREDMRQQWDDTRLQQEELRLHLEDLRST